MSTQVHSGVNDRLTRLILFLYFCLLGLERCLQDRLRLVNKKESFVVYGLICFLSDFIVTTGRTWSPGSEWVSPWSRPFCSRVPPFVCAANVKKRKPSTCSTSCQVVKTPSFLDLSSQTLPNICHRRDHEKTTSLAVSWESRHDWLAFTSSDPSVCVAHSFFLWLVVVSQSCVAHLFKDGIHRQDPVVMISTTTRRPHC